MDELTALAELRADVPPPDPEALAAIRTRLVEHEVRPAVLARPLTTTTARLHRTAALRRRALVGLAAAAAVATGAYALTGTDPAPRPSAVGTAPTTGVPSVAAPSRGTTAATPVRPVRLVNAAQVLDAASAAALRSTVPAGRYAHTSTHSLDVSSVEDPPHRGAYLFSENRYEQWLPGTRTDPGYSHALTNITVHEPTPEQRRFVANAPIGLTDRENVWYRLAANGDVTPIYPRGLESPTCAGGCGPGSAWDASAPATVDRLSTDPAALRRSLFAYARPLHAEATKYHKPTSVSSIALGGIAGVLGSGYASPQLRSALFEVAKTIPGITLRGSMANYDGVRGLAIGITDPFEVEQNLIFATDGSRFLGERTVVVRPSAQYHLSPGTVVRWTAVTTSVTGTPQLPKGTGSGR